jgi:dephospho-CoA kinase
MRDLFFYDSAAKHRLEKILHPLILVHSNALAISPTDAPYTLVVVPLLLESGRYRNWLSRVIVVDCDETKQIARTTQRGSLSEATVRAIMQNQASRLQRLQQADDIIHNDGDFNDLREQVKNLHSRLINL